MGEEEGMKVLEVMDVVAGELQVILFCIYRLVSGIVSGNGI